MSTRRLLSHVAVAAATLALSPPARADWPTRRHDAQRSARSTSPSPGITKPVPYWRAYLGGSLAPAQYVASDVNGDGTVEVVYVAGGKVIAKLPDDTVVWESPPVGINSLVALADVDGDKTIDVIALSSTAAFAISGKDGSIEWQEQDGEMGTVGGARLGDLDGDGRPELFVDECGCCGVTSGSPGVVYSFASGFGGATKPAWLSPAHQRCGTNGDTLGDFDGDGLLDIGYSSYGQVDLVHGKDGKPLGSSASTGTRNDTAQCAAANVDGRPGDELLCFNDTYQASSMVGGHRIFVATFDKTATPPVKLLWSHATADAVNGRVVAQADSVVDLDGDGLWEVVVGEQDGGPFATNVYDAKTGALLASQAGQSFAGVADLDGSGHPLVLTSATSGAAALDAWTFSRPTPQAGALAPRWVLFNASVPYTALDRARAARQGLTAATLAFDVDGDKVNELVVQQAGTGGALDAVVALKGATQKTPTAVATLMIPADVTLLTHDAFPTVNRPYPQLVVTRNDGFLVVLDRSFAATNAGADEFSLPGMRVGGFYSGAYGLGPSPVAASVSGPSAGASLFATDSRGASLRLDAANATLLSPPTVAWTKLGVTLPTVVAGLDGGSKPGVVTLSGATVAALTADGAALWSTNLPGRVVVDALAGDVNGDGVPDVFVEYETAGVVGNFQVLDGKSGKSVWPMPVTEPVQWGIEPFALGDWNGDGKSDLYAVLNTLRVFDGATGGVLASNPTFLAYFEPLIGDVDGDGKEDVTLTGGYYPARTLPHDITKPALWTGGDDRPYPFGVRAQCGGGRDVFAQASLLTPGTVDLVDMSGPHVGGSLTIVLAGGRLFPDLASAAAAKQRRGILGNAMVQDDLVGKGTHPSVLVGSTDGYLYAFDPCAAALDWAWNAGFPVGEAAMADTSGDGIDEIVVTAADGYLYALSQQVIAAPAWVYDTDPPLGITDHDVDTITTETTLYAAWAAVAGATSYEVAVLTPGGSYVTQPDWQNVGAGTSAVLSGLSLADGKRYLVAVRAIAQGKGSSTVAASNGVTVTLGTPPALDMAMAALDGGSGDASGGSDGGRDAASGPTTVMSGGCGCRAGGQEELPSALASALLGVGALAIGRRRRRGR